MINYNRVRRIKYAIYIFIVLLFLVPAVLMIAFGVKMARIMPALDRIIAENSAASAQAPQSAQQPPPLLNEPESSLPSAPSSAPEQYPVPQVSSAPDTTPAATQPEPVDPPGFGTAQEGQELSGAPSAALSGNSMPESFPEQGSPVVKQPPYGDMESPNTGTRP